MAVYRLREGSASVALAKAARSWLEAAERGRVGSRFEEPGQGEAVRFSCLDAVTEVYADAGLPLPFGRMPESDPLEIWNRWYRREPGGDLARVTSPNALIHNDAFE